MIFLISYINLGVGGALLGMTMAPMLGPESILWWTCWEHSKHVGCWETKQNRMRFRSFNIVKSINIWDAYEKVMCHNVSILYIYIFFLLFDRHNLGYTPFPANTPETLRSQCEKPSEKNYSWATHEILLQQDCLLQLSIWKLHGCNFAC